MLGPASHRPNRTASISEIRSGDWWERGITFRALCPCGVERPVPQHAILKMFGQEHHYNEARDIPRIAKALECSTCGRKGQASVRMVMGSP